MTVYTAARTCYSKYAPDKIHSKKIPNINLVNSVIQMGHHSVLEHVSMTFAISGISRACSHQLVRHRIASYSQQSQRYVEFKNGVIDYVVPASIKKGSVLETTFAEYLATATDFYQFLLKNSVTAEDARFVLPNACSTNIVMTVNARELIEMCKVRLCSTAQWEIRGMFNLIRKSVKSNKELKFIAKYLLPKCDWLKFCNEGKRSCGKYPTTEDGV